MGRKKLLAVLIITVLCFMSITAAIAASAAGTVTATSVFDPATKTVTVSGTATSEQINIKVTTTDSTTPVYYGYANVTDGNYSVVLAWSTHAEGAYTVEVDDGNGNKTTSTFTTLDESEVKAAIDVIKAYAEGDDAETLTVEQLTATGATAVITANLAAYKARLASLSGTDVDTIAKIQSIINAVNDEEAAKLGEGVSIAVTYDATAKAVTVAGSASCAQVVIKITKSGDTTPVWYGSANVADGKYAKVIPVSTYSEGTYTVSVENDESGSTVIDGFTIAADTTAPVITIGEYNTNPTNQSITVTATTNEGTLNAASHTFDANGSFEFVATDDAGNVTKKTVTISNIDKTAPVITIGDYTKETTDQDITVTVTTNEGTLNAASHVFAENGSFEFVATDAAGNVTKVTVTITNIDKTVPEESSEEVSEIPSEEPSEEISEESAPVSEEPSEESVPVSEEPSEVSVESDTTSEGTPGTSDFGYFAWILIAMLAIATATVLVRNKK